MGIDDELPRGYFTIDEWGPYEAEPVCECGCAKLYGKSYEPVLHSHWCPVYKKYMDKTKQTIRELTKGIP